MSIMQRDRYALDLRVKDTQHFTYWRGHGWLLRVGWRLVGVDVAWYDGEPSLILTNSRGGIRCFNCTVEVST